MEELALPKKPAAVITAVKLLWASLGIGLVKSALGFAHLAAMASVSFMLTVLVLTLAVMVFLIVKISAGKNWARMVFLILFVLGVIPAYPVLMNELTHAPLLGSLSIAQIVVQIYALYLLFAKAGSVWFRKVTPE